MEFNTFDIRNNDDINIYPGADGNLTLEDGYDGGTYKVLHIDGDRGYKVPNYDEDKEYWSVGGFVSVIPD